MNFKDLLDTVSFEDVWRELKKEYDLEDGAFEVYLNAFLQLKDLTPEPNRDLMRLAVARVEDGLEPGTYIYDVFGIKPGDSEHYALELLPWSRWLSFDVVEKCVDTYSASVVVAHSLYEVTFFGYDAADVEINVKKEIDILKERRRELEDGNAKLIPWDDVCKNIGCVDERTEEEKELQHKQFERINDDNKRVYKMLLS